MNYFIADTHFGHEGALEFDQRPFADVEENDRVLMENWNSAVGAEDDVYILGDISFHNVTRTIELFSALNGKKHLVIGNHDGKFLKNRNFRAVFVEICNYKEIWFENKKGLILSHYPIPCFKNHFRGWKHLYGHVHTSFEWEMMEQVKRQMQETQKVPCLMWNVGAMMPYMGYTPRTLEEIENGG